MFILISLFCVVYELWLSIMFILISLFCDVYELWLSVMFILISLFCVVYELWLSVMFIHIVSLFKLAIVFKRCKYWSDNQSKLIINSSHNRTKKVLSDRMIYTVKMQKQKITSSGSGRNIWTFCDHHLSTLLHAFTFCVYYLCYLDISKQHIFTTEIYKYCDQLYICGWIVTGLYHLCIKMSNSSCNRQFNWNKSFLPCLMHIHENQIVSVNCKRWV